MSVGGHQRVETHADVSTQLWAESRARLIEFKLGMKRVLYLHDYKNIT